MPNVNSQEGVGTEKPRVRWEGVQEEVIFKLSKVSMSQSFQMKEHLFIFTLHVMIPFRLVLAEK